jgi:hypothetical protein
MLAVMPPVLRVDRERFLVLTATLAASATLAPACSAPPRNVPAIATAEAPAPLVIPPLAAASSASPAAGVPVDVPRREADLELANVPGVTRPDPYEGTPVQGQTCDPALNLTGTLPACALRAAGPTCESFTDTVQECPTLKGLLKPRVAAAAVACLNRRSGTPDICAFNVASICAYEALATVCIDPAAKTACAKVTAHCGPSSKMSRSSCEAGLSAIAAPKRAKFLSCITEMCRFETCLVYL